MCAGETAVGVAGGAGNSLLDWLQGSPPPVTLGDFRATGIKCPRPQKIVADRTSTPSTALGRAPGERKTSRAMPRRVLNRNIRVRYFSDDVTVRYFTPQSPPQRVPDRNIRVRYISEDVTVRYLSPKPAEALPSTPNGSPARSVSR